MSDENGATGDDSSVKVNRIVPKLVVTLEGVREEFLAYPRPNQWALMQNAQATKDNDATASLASTYKLAITSVKPEDRARFEAFMLEHGQDENLEDKLTDALFALWDGKSMLPLDSTSSDSSGSTGETVSTSMADLSEPGSPPEPWPTLAMSGSSIPA